MRLSSQLRPLAPFIMPLAAAWFAAAGVIASHLL
jgi:hypothetical protein